VLFIERNGNTDREGFQESKRREEEEVGRVRVALPVEDTEVDEGTEERNVERPLTGSILV
jgi:hypothetical protein